MDDSMLLDVLFILIALLFLPIGFRRGIAREVFVTAGILAGATIAASWARPWGVDLADLVDARNGAGQVAVSTGFVIGGALVLGYAGAAAARLDESGIWGRITGAILAVINGALIAAFVLRDIERYLADDATNRSLAESRVADALLRDFGWVLIGMAAFVASVIAVSLIAGDRRTPAQPVAAPTWQPAAATGGKRKRRLGWGRDDGKVEPQASGFDPTYGRYAADAPHYGENVPIAPVAPATWSMDRAQGRPVGSEWLSVGQSARPEPPAEPAPLRCLACGERLTSEDAFCPRCGRARV
jgi:uncharacterized membrane protein required for colicin V production